MCAWSRRAELQDTLSSPRARSRHRWLLVTICATWLARASPRATDPAHPDENRSKAEGRRTTSPISTLVRGLPAGAGWIVSIRHRLLTAKATSAGLHAERPARPIEAQSRKPR